MSHRSPRLKARVAIADRDDRILCVLHAKPDQEPFWCLPGGNVDRGEGLLAAGVRELLEEVGATVVVDGALLVADGPAVDAVEVILRGSLADGEPGTTDTSGDAYLADVAWFPRTNLPPSFRPAALRTLLEQGPLDSLPTISVADWTR